MNTFIVFLSSVNAFPIDEIKKQTADVKSYNAIWFLVHGPILNDECGEMGPIILGNGRNTLQ